MKNLELLPYIGSISSETEHYIFVEKSKHLFPLETKDLHCDYFLQKNYLLLETNPVHKIILPKYIKLEKKDVFLIQNDQKGPTTVHKIYLKIF